MLMCRFRAIIPLAAFLLFGLVTIGASSLPPPNPLLQPFPDDTGSARTYSTGEVDQSNPFFQPLGTNGRSCATCHQFSHGLTITPSYVQQVFQSSQGLAPLFRTVDGSNSPNADVSTVAARQKAYSMLLNRGTIRIGIGMPANADFQLTAVDDPYDFASASELSLFRRPLPSTNASLFSAVMWDGRETFTGQTIASDLLNQAQSAVLTHEQGGAPPTPRQLALIVSMEQSIYTAQYTNTTAGPLWLDGATGGAQHLSGQPFYLGMNDDAGRNPTGQEFNPNSMRLYSAWSGESGSTLADSRAQVARGELVFTTKPITITNVAGFNDLVGSPVVVGTCTSCHDTPNVANRSYPDFMRTGVADSRRRTPDLPLYTFQCNATGETIRTSDPGRALITGKCSDLEKFKVPSLRALETRSPYFHDGSATSLQGVIDFYNMRFSIGLTSQEQADLIAFLGTL